MLKSFYVKNYKSWGNAVMINMQAESISEHPENTFPIKDNKEKLLKNMAIYGANASGKSNLLDAFAFMYHRVTELVQMKEWNNMIQNDPQMAMLKGMPFQRESCITFANKISNSVFEVTFIVENKEFSYGFELRNRIIKNEWLDINNKTYFDRRKEKLSNISDLKFMIDKIPDDQLYLAYFMEYAKLKLTDPIYQVALFFSKMGVIKDFEKLDGFVINKLLSEAIKSDKKTLERLNKFLKIIDFGIVNIELDNNTNIVNFIHSGTKEIFRIPVMEESMGTKKMIIILLGLFSRLDNGGVVLADEFTSSLHPLLSKLILDIFSDKDYNKNNAQIIFTTHDLFLMSKEQLRRDEISFVYKDKTGQSNYKRLYDIKDKDMKRVRNDAVYWKNYLKGSYEGVPNIDYDTFLSGLGLNSAKK